MMKIGVISDTHFSDLAAGLSFMEDLCNSVFSTVDYILHAGDIVHPDFIHCFNTKPMIAVRGNCDAADPDLPEKRLLEFSGVNIGLVHGWGGPNGLVGNVLSCFEGVPLDALVFGHSHYPLCRYSDDLLIFNPGSATDRRDAPYHSVGILELNDHVRGSIINLDSLSAESIGLSGVFI